MAPKSRGCFSFSGMIGESDQHHHISPASFRVKIWGLLFALAISHVSLPSMMPPSHLPGDWRAPSSPCFSKEAKTSYIHLGERGKEH